MNRSRTASYDLFKLVVALLLAAILILMLLRGCALNPVPAATLVPAASTLAPTAVVPSAGATASPTPSPLPPTATPTTAAATLTPTTQPTAESAADTATPAAAPEAQIEASCNTSVPSRLSVGSTARVIRRLNMRSQPAINAQILQTNATGTRVEIIGGPVCTPLGEQAYQWWQIRLTDGAEGWSAESSLQEASYFLEPIP